MDPESDDDLMAGNELVLSGFVGDSFAGDGFTYAQVVRSLARMSGDIMLRVNSGGGYATEGAAVMAALQAYPGRVTARIEGIAASAASLLVMGADEIVMTPGALLMIHDPAGVTLGNSDQHRRAADKLDRMADTYAAAYAARSGRPADEVRDLMRAETWMNGEEAVALGLADRVETGDGTVAVAAFDFRIYARAPQELRRLADQRGWRFDAQPITAASAATHRKEIAMTAKPEMAAPAKPADVTETTDAAREATMKADEAAQAAKASAEKAVAAERARASGIMDAGTKLGLPVAVMNAMIADGLPLDAAREKMIEEWSKQGDRHEYGARPAQVVRDERGTMREGMEAALFAKLGGPQPAADGKARPYMGMGLVEMAAESIGHCGSLARATAREQVLMTATHATSDFSAIFENVLNKSLAARYTASAPTYREISRFMTFADFRAHPIVSAGDFPKLVEVAQNGEIVAGSFSEKKESLTPKAYGVRIGISRHMMVNDDLNAISQVIADQGQMVAQFEDETFWTMFLSGANADGPTLNENSRQVFNTTDKTKAASGGAIDVTTLGAARKALREHLSLDGRKLNVPAQILLVGPAYETLAEQYVATVQPQVSSNVNPFAGRLRVVVTPWITGNAWYVMPEASFGANFMWGLLDGYSAPRMRMDEPFGTQGIHFSVEHDFGCGASEHRFGYKNAGA